MIDDLLRRARSGDSSAREELLAHLRPQLRAWAENALNARYDRRLDASDLTQLTLLELHQKLEQFVGGTEGQLLAWLKTSLQRNLVDAVRRANAQKRHVGRERSLDAPVDDQFLRDEPSAPTSSPSLRAMRTEAKEQLHRALDQLLPEQRLVVQQVHLEGRRIADVAEQLGRSPGATAKLLQRGLANLRKLLAEEP